MQIAGGAYLETCRDPLDETMAGSGLRAAAALQHVCPELILKSAIDSELRDQAEAMAGGLGVEVDWVERSARSPSTTGPRSARPPCAARTPRPRLFTSAARRA